MTFAATAEVIRYLHAIPVLVDCDPTTLNMDLGDAERKLTEVRTGRLLAGQVTDVVGIIPVHVGGLMMDMDEVKGFAERHGLWVVEDAAHALPAAYRASPDASWRKCGEDTAAVTCYSFYANKTMTTGEGGMAVTGDAELARRMRQMSLHGLSHDGWQRHESGGNWDYKIVAPGYKYNVTDIASAIGIHQLARAEAMRRERESIAAAYRERLADVEELELPPDCPNRVHAWHLFPIRLRLEKLSIDRNQFMAALRREGIGCSVHWRPLHLHPYYTQNYGWTPEQFPTASVQWRRIISLPVFPKMDEAEQRSVVEVVRELCATHAIARQPRRRRPRPR